MHQVNLNDDLYREAEQRAVAAGFANVDDYVADLLVHDLQIDAGNLDRFFTPERLAHIDRAAAQIEAGNLFTSDQVREHFQQKRQA